MSDWQRLEEIGRIIVDRAVHVHRRLGNGLLEKPYELVLAHELQQSGLRVERQVMMPLEYDDLLVSDAYRLDLLVEGLVVIELKMVEKILPAHEAQILSYLRLGGFALGYLLNFHEPLMKDGVRRFINSSGRTA